MSESRFAGRVGFFVVIGLVLIAALMLNFTRGVGLFQPSYEIVMRTRAVGGLKERSAVFMLGVQIGNVTKIDLDQATKTVLVRLKILKKYPIHDDAKFTIDQIGVLGDQFVAIYPGTPGAPLLTGGEEVMGHDPFNLQELARSTTDLLKRFEQLGTTVGEAIKRVNEQVLDAHTLSNFSQTIGNFEKVSERTMTLLDDVGIVISNNAPTVASSLSNLYVFSHRLEKLAGDVDETLVANRAELNASMKNLEEATASLKTMAADINAGKGLVGGLLKDEELKGQLSVMINNLVTVSSNVAHYGLLYKPEKPKRAAPQMFRGKGFE
jgi:phospholipid/cholesterol/gamma-HCH transport system substrate-binding protein